MPLEERRLEFVELLTTGQKTPWLRDQALKGLGRISVEGYVAGSTAFYEDYLRRLSTYAGREVPAAAPRGD